MSAGAEGKVSAEQPQKPAVQEENIWQKLRRASVLTLDAIEAWLDIFKGFPSKAADRVIDGQGSEVKPPLVVRFNKRK